MTSIRCKVSVALDIGGSSTGYAIKSFDRSSADIIYSQWGEDDDHKTKTSVLFDPSKKLVAFGQEAETKLAELKKDGQEKKWFYFDNIKRVMLGKCNKDTTFVSKNRKSMHATEVFEALFVYFRQHILKTCRGHKLKVDASEVLWIVVIPTGTEDTTGALLLQCANQAGIGDDQILLVSDTRALAEYMQTAYGEHIHDVFETGGSFIVCDTGGLTVDIGGYRVKDTGELEERLSVHDSQHGSDVINDAYLLRLTDFLGANVVQAIRDYHPSKINEMLKLLNTSMRYMTSEMAESFAVALEVPSKLVEVYRTFNPGAPKTGVVNPSKKYPESVELTDKTLTLETKLILPIFQFTVEGVVSALRSAFGEEELSGIISVFMSGGLSEFPLLQDALDDNFPETDFYYVENPRDIVMLGALVVAHGKETQKTLEDIPQEVQSLSLEDQLLYCDSIQKGYQITNHVTLTVLSHAEMDRIAVIRSLVDMKDGNLTGLQEGLFTAHIGKFKAYPKSCSTLKTCMIPVGKRWRLHDQTRSDNTDLPRKPRQDVSGLPDVVLCSMKEDPKGNKEKPETKDKSEKEESFTKKTKAGPLVDEETLVPCVFKLHGGLPTLYWSLSGIAQRSIYLILFSLDSYVTGKIKEPDLTTERKSLTSLTNYLTSWIRFIYAACRLAGYDSPIIIPFGVHSDKGSKMSLLRTRYKIAIKAVLRTLSRDPPLKQAVKDHHLMAHYKNPADEGYDRLRSLILDMYSDSRDMLTVKRPTSWLSMEDIIERKRSEDVKFLSLKELTSATENKLSSEEVEVFLKCQHENGNIIYDRNCQEKKVVIINSKWPLQKLLAVLSAHHHDRTYGKNDKTPTGEKFPLKGILSENTVRKYLISQNERLSKGRLNLLLRVIQSRGNLCQLRQFDPDGEMVSESHLVVPSRLENPAVRGFLEWMYDKAYAISLRYNLHSPSLVIPIFHRLLGSALATWPAVKYQGKLLLMRKMGIFQVDNFHRFILITDKSFIMLLLCNRKGNININPSICKNVQQFLDNSLRRILGLKEGDTSATNDFFSIDVATCNEKAPYDKPYFTPCFKSLQYIRSEESWTCRFHEIYGRCEDVLNVWFTAKEQYIQSTEDLKPCAQDCSGPDSNTLLAPPTEKMIGRLVRRLEPRVVKRMAEMLGLKDYLMNLIEKEHRKSSWKLGFHYLSEIFILLKKTTEDLRNALVECGQDVHLLCRVQRIQKEADPRIPKDRLDKTINTQELIAAADNISHDEFQLAIELGIPTNRIRKIVENSLERGENLFIRELFLEWKRTYEFPATFRALSSALAEVKLDSICILNAINVHTYNQLV